MIHIVFNDEDANALEQAIALDDSLKGTLNIFTDDYSVGPIADIYAESGIENRKEWWNTVLYGGDFEQKANQSLSDDNAKINELIEFMRNNPEENIWIWAAQNAHDVCGYYWLLHSLKEFQGRVMILYLNNLPFINEKGNIFYPVKLSGIPPKEFIKAKKLAREITLSEFEVDPDEWMKLCLENKGIRILEGGKKLNQYEYDYFDSELKKFIMPDWQKANKIIHNCISKSKQTVSEAYLLWRLKDMIDRNIFEVQGKISNMKDFEVKYFSKAD